MDSASSNKQNYRSLAVVGLIHISRKQFVRSISMTTSSGVCGRLPASLPDISTTYRGAKVRPDSVLAASVISFVFNSLKHSGY